MGKTKRQARWFWWLLLMAALYPAAAPAQRVVTLIGWTNQVWRFNDSGLELGTAWRTNTYDDTVWPGSGTGLFGVESFIAGGGYGGVPAFTNITTPMALGPAENVTTTFYFRAYFNLDASNLIAGTVLISTNLIDDGAVVYLNGIEAGRFRVPGNQSAATYANDLTAVEGTNEVLAINTNLLRIGTNLLAVEVHQISAASTDVVWGHTLLAIVPYMLAITNQPRSQTNVVGSTAVFSVGVSGTPVTYTWQKETSPGSGVWGAPNPASQNLPTYTIPAAALTTNHAGNYRVIASNISGSVTSVVARLFVVPDVVPPFMLSAQPGSLSGVTNRIFIRWSELLNAASAITASNYTVRMFPQTNLQVGVLSSIYSSSNIILNLDTNANWHVGRSNYFITVNNVRDTSGNVVAPNSQIALSWPLITTLVNSDDVWDFHAAAYFEPEVFNTPWMTPGYLKSSWWGQGRSGFSGGFTSPNGTCLGAYMTTAGFQPEPMLFRTTFQWPAGFPSIADLRLRSAFDDAVVFYLNGREIYRYNVPLNAPVTASLRAVSSVSGPDCRTNSVPSVQMLPGENALAVAVIQANDNQADVAFAMSMDSVLFVPGPLPDQPVPTLEITRMDTNLFHLFWTGGGYALESTTNLPAPPGALPYFGWTAVPNMSNPFFLTNDPAQPPRFFRLRK